MIARRINDVERHSQEKIANEDGQRAVHDCLGGGATDADCALARGQSFVATNEDDEDSETERFRQPHDNVAVARPAHHVRHVIGAVDFEQEDRHEITDCDSNRDAFRYQQRHRHHHGERARHDEVIGRINRQRAQCVNLLGYLHGPDFGRHGRANSTRDHESR